MFKGKGKDLRWLVHNAVPVMPGIIVLTVLGVLISYISVRFAFASRDLLDYATGNATSGFGRAIARIAILLVADLTVQSIYNILSVRTGAKYKNDLQNKLFSHIARTEYASLGDYHSGELVNRLTKDISLVSSNIIELVPSVVMLVSGVVMSFWALFVIDASLSLICVALGPLVLVASVIYGKKVKNLHSKCLTSDGKILSFMQECIQNVLVIKAFGKEKAAAHRTASLQRENYGLNMKVGYVSLGVNVMYFLAMTAAYYFAVAWCAYKISIGIMTVGSFAAIIQLVGDVQSPFREISGTFSRFFATCASAERIMEIEQLPKDDAGNDYTGGFDKIEIKDVSFAYDDNKVLENLSFVVEKGDIAVITGVSGGGKSTLMKLLVGIYKTDSGEINIYNNEEKIPLTSSARSLFSYVPQGNMIISGTIADNIAFMGEVDREKARNAADVACISDYIDTLPEGMDTVLGENGLGLSEGQVQRLAVARAIYSDTPIILLDEATSSLDADTEAKILENIRALEDKTCIITAHRPKVLEIANKRLHLDKNEG